MTDIILLSGSPSEESRTEAVLRYVGSLLEKEGIQISYLSVRDVNAEDIVQGRFDSPEIQEIGRRIAKAQAVVIGSPVYKSAYSGVLKAVLDILPQDILKGKPVLPVMTGGTITHCLAIDYSLKPLISALKGQALQGVFILDKCVNKTSIIQVIEDIDLEQRLKKAIYELTVTLKEKVY